jgi:hypothetical protein
MSYPIEWQSKPFDVAGTLVAASRRGELSTARVVVHRQDRQSPDCHTQPVEWQGGTPPGTGRGLGNARASFFAGFGPGWLSSLDGSPRGGPPRRTGFVLVERAAGRVLPPAGLSPTASPPAAPRRRRWSTGWPSFGIFGGLAGSLLGGAACRPGDLTACYHTAPRGPRRRFWLRLPGLRPRGGFCMGPPCRGVIGLRQVDGMAGRQPVLWARARLRGLAALTPPAMSRRGPSQQ